jgi:L-threonylcarbamoyladenylate synthase
VTPHRLRHVVRLLRTGGVIAYPTEAVYGLGCDPDDEIAVRRILALKRRPAAKGLILIAADFEQLKPYLLPPGDAELDRIRAVWPGPVTWLLPARPEVPRWLRGDHETLAVRVTAHPLSAELCRAFGKPLVSTSANRAGRPPARTALAVRRQLGRGVDLVLNGRLGASARPSEIRDLASGRVIRAG